MTLGSSVPMGGPNPSVNNEIGQGPTQTVSFNDRAVRTFTNFLQNQVSLAGVRNTGQAVQIGIAVFSRTGLSSYGWINQWGWGALSATFPNAFGGDPAAIDTRGTTNPVFMVTSPYGNFVYGTFITTGTAYSATVSAATSGSFNNDVRNLTYIGTRPIDSAQFYLYSNLAQNGFFSVLSRAGLGTPVQGTIAANFRVYWVEAGAGGIAYFTRPDSATQKIGIINNLLTSSASTVSYFSAQGTDAYYGLANSTSVIFAAGGTGLAHAWNLAGTTKFAAPTTQVAGPGICRVNNAGNVVFYSNNVAPYVHAWNFTASAFGTKYADPPIVSPNIGAATQIYIHPSDNAVCFIVSGRPIIYSFNFDGFGYLYPNPNEINAVRSVAAFFNRSF